MESKEYKVILARTDIEDFNPLFEKIKDSFDIAKGAYATELSLMTERDEGFFKIHEPNEPQPFCLAIDEDNNVLGFILLEADSRTMTLWTCHVYVRPEVRGMGVYKLMMKRVKKFAEDAGFRYLFSIVHKRNDVSQKAHAHVGFKKRWIGYEIPIEPVNDNKKMNKKL